MISAETYYFRDFELDLQRASLRTADGEFLGLRPKSFDVLHFFVANAGRVIGKRELIDAVWPDVRVDEDSLFHCIREIRAALGDDDRQLIRSVAGDAYIFAADVTGEPGKADRRMRVASDESGPEEPRAAALTEGSRPLLAMDPEDWLFDPRGRERPPLFGPGWLFRLTVTLVALVAVIGIAVAVFGDRSTTTLAPERSVVSVTPFLATSSEPQTARMAADLTERLSDGLSKIGNIEVASADGIAEMGARGVAERTQPRFVVAGQLQQHADSWEVQAHLADAATGEVLWATSFAVGTTQSDVPLQEYRLAGGIGYGLALRINKILDLDRSGRRDGSRADDAAYVIEQANALINHTTPDRFQAAEKMLTQALDAYPDNVELKVALASHQMRGLQLRWYPEASLAEKKASIRSMLEAALQAKPSYLPALEGYCRLLTATNDFIDGLVACAKTLGFNPWDGTALFEMGLSQIQLARFDDALASFVEADRFDTPATSRWTWLLGAGWASLCLDRNEEARNWLERSIAITPGTGRTHLLLAVAYQRLGRPQEAKLTLAQGLQIDPNLTAKTAPLPPERTHPAFREAGARIMRTLIELGLPPG